MSPIHQYNILLLDRSPSILDQSKMNIANRLEKNQIRLDFTHKKYHSSSAQIEFLEIFPESELKKYNHIIFCIYEFNEYFTLQRFKSCIQNIKKIHPVVVITIIKILMFDVGMFYKENAKKDLGEYSNAVFLIDIPLHIPKFTSTSNSEKYSEMDLSDLEAHVIHMANAKKAQIRENIARFCAQFSQTETCDAQYKIKHHLERSMEYSNPNDYFQIHQHEIKTILKALQHTKASYFNTIANFVVLTILACSVIGLPLLWITGVLKNNYEKTSYFFMFLATGHKQRTQVFLRKIVKDISGCYINF